MAISIDTEEFLAPLGFIEPETMFPEEDEETLDARIQAYVEQANTLVSALAVDAQKAAIINYVYWKAFFAVYVSLSGTPSSYSMADEGSNVYSTAQIANFKTLADQYKAAFEGALSSVIPESNLDRIRSYSVQHVLKY